MPDFTVPIQLWEIQVGLRQGGMLNLVTDMTAEEVTEEITSAKVQGREYQLRAIVPDNNWPVTVNGDPDSVVLRLVKPHKQYLASRPNLVMS